MDIDLGLVEVIFFDAAGTLFHVRGSVGEIYTTIARNYGVAGQPAEVEEAFITAFQAKSAEGMRAHAGKDRLQEERLWWMEVVRRAFTGRIPESVLPAYFEEVFNVFRGAAGWVLYPDTITTLRDLRSRGYRLGVLSNFDSRLDDVLANLGIGDFFNGVVFSWSAGFAKPDARIFHHALQVMQVPAANALHVGDSPEDDFAGASGAGLNALLVDRGNDCSDTEGMPRISSLSELCRLLPQRR